jgi:hypothetical protein
MTQSVLFGDCGWTGKGEAEPKSYGRAWVTETRES